jgi:hypothetical protein
LQNSDCGDNSAGQILFSAVGFAMEVTGGLDHQDGFTMKHATKAQPSSKDLDEAITVAMRGMQELREQNARLRASNNELEHRHPVLEREIATLKAQLDNERNERRHYHSLANELITRIDIVVRTVDGVVQCAQHVVHSMREEESRADLPELIIPAFLKQRMVADDPAEPKADAPGLTNIRPLQAWGHRDKTDGPR